MSADPGDERFGGWFVLLGPPLTGEAGAGVGPNCCCAPGVFRLCLGELSSSRGGLIDLYLWIIITLDRAG